jgi:hypothetical protein
VLFVVTVLTGLVVLVVVPVLGQTMVAMVMATVRLMAVFAAVDQGVKRVRQHRLKTQLPLVTLTPLMNGGE